MEHQPSTQSTYGVVATLAIAYVHPKLAVGVKVDVGNDVGLGFDVLRKARLLWLGESIGA